MEAQIEQLEEDKQAVEAEMAKPEVAVVSAEVMRLHEKLLEMDQELEQLYAQWEDLTNL